MTRRKDKGEVSDKKERGGKASDSKDREGKGDKERRGGKENEAARHPTAEARQSFEYGSVLGACRGHQFMVSQKPSGKSSLIVAGSEVFGTCGRH